MNQKQGNPNRLQFATSPYLLQHAYNPVDWYEWGDEALQLAKREGKPILVSIGYSSCHWCHVMERESFVVPEIAALMENFVCIKVDREERPDVDHVYMEAVQAMGLHGGWPLNVFLTPDQKPFYGGTYFPPERWAALLRQVHNLFQEKRKELEENADQLSQHLTIGDLQRFGSQAGGDTTGIQQLEKMFRLLADRFDKTWGGIEKAPKFVMPSIWMFLLRYHFITKNPEALNMVNLTVTRMVMGGLYDQLGGGFSRYSVDEKWFAPHFEKMLYDNAQLLSLYAEAYAVSHHPVFAHIVRQTTDWLQREMTHPAGGFYAALDADSEGEEGKFYTWTYPEVADELGDSTAEFARNFQVTPEGNWEHGRNILNPLQPPQGTDFNDVLKQLLEVRNQRIRPSLDDKILSGWNGMTIKGLADAYRAFGEIKFLNMAKSAMDFIENNLIHAGKVYRSFRNICSPTEGFLEDYAFIVQGYLALYQATFDERYLAQANQWCTYTIINFFDAADGFFYFSGKEAGQLIARKKEIFDNVIPSSNSVMARNLYQLGVMMDNRDWIQKATHMAEYLREITATEPGYMSNWGILLAEITQGLAEVVIAGPKVEEFRKELSRIHLPFVIFMGTATSSTLPLFEGRESKDKITRIYVCRNKTCQMPVTTVEEAMAQLNLLN